MIIRYLTTKVLTTLCLVVSTSVSANAPQILAKLAEGQFEWVTDKATFTVEVDCSSASAIYIDEVIQQCQVFVWLESKSNDYTFNVDGLNRDLTQHLNRSLYPLNSIDWSNVTYLTAKDSNNTTLSQEKLAQFNYLIIEELATQALDKAKLNNETLIHYILLSLSAIVSTIFITLNKMKKNHNF